ncbi:MAG: hypothetical protein J6577_01375 [Gilliamella sp.]|uniref:hypothetical protein n=1 Tax=Gilliamella sp. TaxID=1891236 RepID=UPI0025CFD74B|nr:hypothetical protein [Gilliamella sp.]MCO6549542.1 hypothetical protein [Gilliamella sp.]MCO6555868.1 hypothetical protein [Gilliamella sp.]
MENQKTDEKGGILFKEIGFWSVFFTALLYVNAYIYEAITAIYFGFDVDLISLSMSVIIKNSLIPFVLIAIAVIIILSNIENNKKPTADNANTADNTKKIILEIVVSIVFAALSIYFYYNYYCHYNVNMGIKIAVSVINLIVIGFFYLSKILKNHSKLEQSFITLPIFFAISSFTMYIASSWTNFFLIIILILFLIIWFCIYCIVESDNILKLYCWLAGLFICLVVCAGALSFYLVIDNSKPHQSFKYNGQDYILLRNYDGNLVAKKITIIQQKKYCFNEGILYLPTNALKKELNLKEVNFIGNCNELSILKRRNFLNRF